MILLLKHGSVMKILDLNTYHYQHPSGLNVYYFKDANMTEFSAKLAVKYGALELSDNIASGSAHFLEHIMFHHETQDYMDIFTQLKASSNAYTTYTHTCYEFSTATNFKKPLKVLFDLVNNFDATQESIEKEREIINEELKMYAQMPSEIIRDLHYNNICHDSNYRFDIGGTIESISKLDYENLKAIFDKYYVAANQTLFCASSIEFSEIITLVDEFYNQIKFQEVEFEAVVKETFNQPKMISKPHNIQTNITKVSYAIKHNLSIFDYLFLKSSLDTLASELNPDFKKALLKTEINESFYYQIIRAKDINMIEFTLYSEQQAEAFIKLCSTIIKSINDNPYIEQGMRKLIGNEIRKMDNIGRYRDYFVHYYYNDLVEENYLDLLFNPNTISTIVNHKFELIDNQPYVTNVYPRGNNE